MTRCLLAAVAVCVVSSESALAAAEAPSKPVDVRLAAWVEAQASNYSADVQMLGAKFSGPGYHTTVKSGTWAHSTVNSLDYAHGLLLRNAPGDAPRAAAIIAKVITLQDTDPQHKTYGIWPWLLEEPLEKMSPPDWNWADFCGARLAQMLHDHADLLPAPVQNAMRSSLRHATAAIRKRNVGPDYTNIAVMGGGVCAAAGELLDDPAILDYGRQRLQRVVDYTHDQGGFNEYNSPTYTMVALWESERALRLVRDPATRSAAEAIRRTAWELIAGSFHPATGQWAGPHSRAYSDYVFAQTAEYLAEQTGASIAAHAPVGNPKAPRLPNVNALPCPADLAARFRTLPQDPLELRRTFARGKTTAQDTVGTTWLSAAACLGSVNRASFWTQRRPIIGYWATDADPAVCFRVRFLHDDRDFASMGLVAQQRGPRVLLAVHSLKNQGDWHPGLDRPKDGTFTARDFRLRLELTGKDAVVEDLGGGRFALRAGTQRVVIHTAAGQFAGNAVTWTPRHEPDHASVDAVCYHGEPQAFDFRQPLDVALAVGLELLPATAAPGTAAVEIVRRPPAIEATWNTGAGLQVVTQ